MNKIFLSHSSHDKQYVEYIATKLGKDIAIYDTFSFESGLKTFDEILKELDVTDLFVIFLSNSALESEWVKKELNISNELKQKEKLKQIYPIIIDSSLSYSDPRIPKWLNNNGFNSYNLRHISSPKLAYRKIKNQLIFLNNQSNNNLHKIYIGHEDLIKKFDEEYYIATNAPKCIIACGIEGIGRESFIRECIKVPKTFSIQYEPIVIATDSKDSIDVIISKLIDCGFGNVDLQSINEINELNIEKKISLLSSIFIQIQNSKEFIIFRDDGALIEHGEVSWWLAKALTPIRNELTIGIVSFYNVHKSVTSRDCYIERINELDDISKLKLLDKLSKVNEISLDREDIKFFQGIITGHPLQIIFCVEKIKRESLEEVKTNSFEIREFLSDSTIKIIDKYLALLNYNEEKKVKFLSYLSFLTSYSNIPITEVLQINKLNSDYTTYYHDLLSFCIARRTGLNNDLLSISPSVIDYIERNSNINKPKEIDEYLKCEYNKFKICLKEDDLDEYCYSQIEQNLKELIINNDQSDYKYIYPSIILKAVVKLYNNKSYKKAISICKNSLNLLESWDATIRQSFYFYYAMSVAKVKDNNIFCVLLKQINGEYILEKFQADFVRGFYYKLLGKYEDAIKQFQSCLNINAHFFQPRRELVETYILIEEYDLALDLVSINYKKYPDNIFNIYQYFNCLIRQKAPDLEKISELLNKAKDIDRLPTSSKNFYANMKSLYERFITHDKEKAIRILIENKSVFDNLIYYYRDLFDLYLETKNVKKMQEVFEYLKKTIDDDLSFYPLLFRRVCALLYFQTNDFILVSNRITVSNAISSTTKDKIRAYLKTLQI
ncbi:MAG: hypothetical protein BHV87_15045 [Clostridiales bacterium 36_14]|nr:MAG: hypothetical protein BHV87_15045 [Clostridiales bacterium 36_14]